MAPKLNRLRQLTDKQIVEAHDGLAPTTSVGVNYYLDELTRREFARTSEAALTEARSARRLAGVNAFVAGAAVIIAVAVPLITNALAADPPTVGPCSIVDGADQRPALCVLP